MHSLFFKTIILKSLLPSLARVGNSLIGFLSKSLVFFQKNEQIVSKWAMHSKKEGIRSNKNKRLAHSLIFGEQTEQIAHF